MPRRSTTGRVSQTMGRHPAAAPFADGAIRGADGSGNLLVVLLRMFMGSQNDPGTHRRGLRCGMGTDELLKLLGFFSRQFNWMSGFGTTHWLSPPTLSLSS